MNERIRLLAIQSFGTPGGPDACCLDLEKFAELIVEELCGVVEKLSPGYQDYRNQIEDAFRRDCIAEMKQHFGVEE